MFPGFPYVLVAWNGIHAEFLQSDQNPWEHKNEICIESSLAALHNLLEVVPRCLTDVTFVILHPNG